MTIISCWHYTVTVVADAAAALPRMLIELLLGSCGAETLLFLAFSRASSFSKVSGLFLSLGSRLTSLSGVCDRLLPEMSSERMRYILYEHKEVIDKKEFWKNTVTKYGSI